jgi:hypothetical protein
MPAETTIKKDELIEVLNTNRAEHREKFLTAQEAYRARVIEILDQRLADARAGRRIDLAFRLPVPEDHTADYDRELRMLEMEVGDTVTLDSRLFDQLVMDNWSWSHAFATTNAAYAVE